jgi:hypothetical protein
MELMDFIEKIKGLSTQNVLSLLDDLSKYEPLHNTLSGLPEEKRELILKKIELFSESDAKEDQLNEKG